MRRVLPVTSIGFTGARRVTPMQRLYIRAVIRHLEADTFVSGACKGVDEVAAQAVREFHPNAHNVIVVPVNLGFVTPGFLDDMSLNPMVSFVEMPARSSYRDRNQVIVDESNALIGFPLFTEDHPQSVRSGTWQTIRMGRRAYIAGGHTVSPDARVLTDLVPGADMKANR